LKEAPKHVKTAYNLLKASGQTGGGGGPNLDPGQDPEDPNKDKEETKSGERKQDNKTVYQSMNKETKEIDYVGITNNFERRAYEHARTKDIKIEKIKGLEKLSTSDAKAVEQTLIEFHELGKNGGSLLNKINSIAQSNPGHSSALKRGMEILKNIEHPGF
jgi:filamentous hemagglutinin